jgi:hypothetical protein
MGTSRQSHHLYGAVVVAVVAVRVVQVAAHQIVGVIAVGHGLVAAIGAVLVADGVAGAGVLRRAIRRVRGPDLDRVLAHAAVRSGVVQMAVVKVIGVVAVLDRGVTTARTVRVIVILVRVGHDSTPKKGMDSAWTLSAPDPDEKGILANE